MSKKLVFVVLLAGAGIVLVAANPARVHALPPGIQLWFDADDASTIDLDGSNNVTEWRDKSGNGIDMTSLATPDDPAYDATGAPSGLPTVRFTDRNSLENLGAHAGLPTTQSRTYFFAGRLTNNDAPPGNGQDQEWYFSYGTSSPLSWNTLMYYDPDSNDKFGNFIVIGGGGNSLVSTDDLYDATTLPAAPRITEYEYDLGVGRQRFHNDGVLDPTDNTTGTPMNTTLTQPARLGIGVESGPNVRADIDHYELILFDRTLSEAERNEVGNYLSTKWNIPSSYIPEPSSVVLLLLSSAAMLSYGRRRRATR